MFYPETFIESFAKAFPGRQDLCQLLEQEANNPEDDWLIGHFLGKQSFHASYTPISFRQILEATSLEELQGKARASQEASNLYLEWQALCAVQNNG